MADYIDDQEDRDATLIDNACLIFDMLAEKKKNWIVGETKALIIEIHTASVMANLIVKSKLEETENALRELDSTETRSAFGRYTKLREKVQESDYHDPLDCAQALTAASYELDVLMKRLMGVREVISGLRTPPAADDPPPALDTSQWKIPSN